MTICSTSASAQDFVPIFDIIDSATYTPDLWGEDANNSEQRKQIGALKRRQSQVLTEIASLEQLSGDSENIKIFGEIDLPDEKGLQLNEAKRNLEALESEIEAVQKELSPKTNFWTSKTQSFTAGLGLSVNPNKLRNEEGKVDHYFSPSLITNFTNKIKDSDGKEYSYSAISLTNTLFIQDHIDDLGRDVELSSLTGSFTKIFDDCWAGNISSSAGIITTDFYSDRFAWSFPVSVLLKRQNFADNKSCKIGGSRNPESVTTLEYKRTLSDPSSLNLHEIKLAYSRNIPLNKNTSLNIAPAINFTSFSNLANDAKLDYTDFQLGVSAIRKLDPKTSLILKTTIGKRNSNENKRNSDFAELPLSLNVVRSF